jgi:hypothetical protein
MLKIDRMEFPRKYPIPGWVKFVVLALVIAGIWMHNCSQDQLAREIVISDVVISAYTKVHIEVEYSIHNRSRIDRDAWLLLRVSDDRDEELASSMFVVSLKAGEKKDMVKVLDKLSRPLADNEEPKAVKLEIFKRKVLS